MKVLKVLVNTFQQLTLFRIFAVIIFHDAIVAERDVLAIAILWFATYRSVKPRAVILTKVLHWTAR